MRRCRLVVLAAALTALGVAPPAAGAACADRDLVPTADNLAQVVAATLCEMNAQRAAAGLAPLTRSRQLDRSARYHADDMAFFRYFAHRREGGPSVLTRIRSTGYFTGVAGGLYTENLADAPQSRDSAGAVVDAWMASEEHRANLLKEPFRNAGIAIEFVPADLAFYPDTPSTLYVVDYGRRYYRRVPGCTRRSRTRGHRYCRQHRRAS
jgi:uncharacterized protein YkwD